MAHDHSNAAANGPGPGRRPHPLDPLGPSEIDRAAALLRADPRAASLSPRTRFLMASSVEPEKGAILADQRPEAHTRTASLLLMDHGSGLTHEVTIDLSRDAVAGWRSFGDRQPQFLGSEGLACERAVKADPGFRAALRRRGITDLEHVVVDGWPAGHFHDPAEEGLRLARAVCYISPHPGANYYAHPVGGLVAVVDLHAERVMQLIDVGGPRVPGEPAEYTPDAVGAQRTGLRPLDVVQRDGPSFTIDGREVRWLNWSFRVGFTPREGLVLHTVAYDDGGRRRSILHRASLAELVTPYGDPAVEHYFRNAFDAGENGFGAAVNALELGCDCLGEIRYFDAYTIGEDGGAVRRPNAICLHEEDVGVLWKHTDWRTATTEVRRSRRLAVSSFSTLGNYDYGLFWYFYLDGTIEFEAKMTGIVATGAVAPDEEPRYGTLLAPGLQGMLHQHFFNVRLDLDVDGPVNRVVEVDVEPVPPGPDNRYGTAFASRRTVLASERQAQRLTAPHLGRVWEVESTDVRNRHGRPVAYRLVPGGNVLPAAQPDSPGLRRAGFTTRHLWVTRHSEVERYAAGDYPYQHPGGAGLPEWTRADRDIDGQDVVLWYTLGHHHLVRPEDWPVMPVARVGFALQPAGFFDRNPALDVPPPHAKPCH